jgi:hypothetical protein
VPTAHRRDVAGYERSSGEFPYPSGKLPSTPLHRLGAALVPHDAFAVRMYRGRYDGLTSCGAQLEEHRAVRILEPCCVGSRRSVPPVTVRAATTPAGERGRQEPTRNLGGLWCVLVHIH